jgi:cardiolipin synthase A/B
MKRARCLLAVLLCLGCAEVIKVYTIPEITLGEASFLPTIEAYTDTPIVHGNRIEILFNGDETFPAMLRDIKKARYTITFAQYLYKDGPIARDLAQALSERCRLGVQAHVLIDSQGSSDIPDEISAVMREAGCHVEFFHKVDLPQIIFPWKLVSYNYRNHRRILVIDGQIGFTGGYGISEAWMGDGPAVQHLQAAFVESWLETTGVALGGKGYFPRLEPRGNIPAQMVKSSPAGGSFQNYLLFLLSISSAKKSILITNPYFIPDDRIVDALLRAAARGVRVVVLVPGKIDVQLTYRASRSNYGRMLLGGIQIFEYTAALMHAKTMVVDGVWATLGSTNFDNRSFALNEELNLTVYHADVARRLHDAFEDDLKYSKQITYEEWKARGLKERFFELFAWPLKEQL